MISGFTDIAIIFVNINYYTNTKFKKHTYPNRILHKTDCVRYHICRKCTSASNSALGTAVHRKLSKKKIIPQCCPSISAFINVIIREYTFFMNKKFIPFEICFLKRTIVEDIEELIQDLNSLK